MPEKLTDEFLDIQIALFKREQPGPNWLRKHSDFSGSVVYFQLKSCCVENIFVSQREGIWASTPKNALKLLEAYLNTDNVILIFAVNNAKKFYGYARMDSMPHNSLSVGHFGIMEQTFLAPCFRVSWINTRILPFDHLNGITNSLNDNLPVRISRDGQELDKEAGEKLCKEIDGEIIRYEKNHLPCEEQSVETLSNEADNSMNENKIVNSEKDCLAGKRNLRRDFKVVKRKKY